MVSAGNVMLFMRSSICSSGIAFKGDRFDEEVVRVTLHTNYFGLQNVCKHFLPLLRANARVVNVSSSAGVSALRKASKALQEQFTSDKLTVVGY